MKPTPMRARVVGIEVMSFQLPSARKLIPEPPMCPLYGHIARWCAAVYQDQPREASSTSSRKRSAAPWGTVVREPGVVAVVIPARAHASTSSAS